MNVGMWDIVAVSSGRQSDTSFFTEQLEARRVESPKWGEQLGISSGTLIIPVPDPFLEDSSRKGAYVGSGGATLNAILHVAEHISIRHESGSLMTNVFEGWKIAVLLCGTAHNDVASSELGKAFTPLPLGSPATLSTGGITNAELMLLNLQRIADPCPSVWVCSTEWLLHVPPGFQSPFSQYTQQYTPQPGITALALPAPVTAANDHGVYVVGPNGVITNVLYRPGVEKATEAGAVFGGQVLIVAPVVRFCPKSAETFLGLHAQVPFDACTYYGSDSASPPARLNLYLDVLISACENRLAYLKRGETSQANDLKASNLNSQGRSLLVRTFSETVLKAAIPTFPPYYYIYPSDKEEWLEGVLGLRQTVDFTKNDLLLSTSHASHIPASSRNEKTNGSAVFRSWIGENVTYGNSTLIHCSEIGEGCVIGNRCRIYHATLEPNTTIEDGTTIGALNSGETNLTKEEYGKLETAVKDVISDEEKEQRLKGMSEQHSTMKLCNRIDMNELRNVLLSGKDVCVYAELCRLAASKITPIQKTLKLFDNTIEEVDLHRLARVLYTQADFLACCAKGRGGLRSGPARNPAWLPAITAIQRWDGTLQSKKQWIQLLSIQREKWLGSPESLIRAARHYEGAAAVITARGVDTATQFITYTKLSMPPLGVWIRAEAPARIDLSGGWTDTPPISYEAGGLVVNVAIKVNNTKPLKAYCRRLSEPILKLRTDETETVVTEVQQMLDYNQPQAPAAILKAALVALHVIDLHGASLHKQLLNMGGGLEVRSCSTLPVGSGLGGSSILGGVILAAIGSAIGRLYNKNVLVHAVLRLEQLLTSGGGWQDQVGGFFGGVKSCNSAPVLPLKVSTDTLTVPPAFLEKLCSHFVLVYTGRARLARNLLQGVLRRWAARLPDVVATVKQLRRTSADLISAIKAEDIPRIGECVMRYWGQKKLMAGTGVEPPVVPKAIAVWKEHIHGYALGGAGGGGFMLAITKKPDMAAKLEAMTRFEGGAALSFYPVSIDTEGLVVTETEEGPSCDM
eukprot:TRINITY_DN12437_c0_g1_i1.p1 TRINITY_DN12437_c0_g1~~TRINITY_DN12437_c0_g1_i1.p1  ORF type:complete len:1026 (+),score=82.23 TRINITY_DN12437_c0_g1_i1:65-3142(+)